MDWWTFGVSVGTSLLGSSVLTAVLQHHLSERKEKKLRRQQADAVVLNRTFKILPFVKCQEVFEGGNLASSHRKGSVVFLWKYMDESDLPERNLMDPYLEQLRAEMVTAARAFLNTYGEKVFQLKVGVLGIPHEWTGELRTQAQLAIRTASMKFFDQYKRLHDAAREKLGILIREEHENG